MFCEGSKANIEQGTTEFRIPKYRQDVAGCWPSKFDIPCSLFDVFFPFSRMALHQQAKTGNGMPYALVFRRVSYKQRRKERSSVVGGGSRGPCAVLPSLRSYRGEASSFHLCIGLLPFAPGRFMGRPTKKEKPFQEGQGRRTGPSLK